MPPIDTNPTSPTPAATTRANTTNTDTITDNGAERKARAKALRKRTREATRAERLAARLRRMQWLREHKPGRLWGIHRVSPSQETMVEWQAAINTRRAARIAEREARREQRAQSEREFRDALANAGGILVGHFRSAP
jgi:hypothetical protein